MSQYGAEGAARLGRTHLEILRFYYPGTSIARRGAHIRVLLTGDTTSDVKVSPARGLSVRDLGDRRRWTLPVDPRITRWRITPNPDRVEYHRNGTWRTWTSPDGRRTLLGDAEFKASGPITLWVPRGSVEVGKRYRGALRAATPSPGASSRDTVWTRTITASSIESAYPSIGRFVRLRVTRRDGNGEWGGRVLTAVIDGTRRDVTVTGTTLRSRFGLRSTWFRVL